MHWKSDKMEVAGVPGVDVGVNALYNGESCDGSGYH
jgi:hypothetical protein